MGKPNGKSDPIGEAIAATADPAPIRMHGVTVTIASTGRPFQINVPLDLTPIELLEMIGWMATGLPQQLGAARGPQLVVPAGSRLVLPS